LKSRRIKVEVEVEVEVEVDVKKRRLHVSLSLNPNFILNLPLSYRPLFLLYCLLLIDGSQDKHPRDEKDDNEKDA
jgi:hypothetical protein